MIFMFLIAVAAFSGVVCFSSDIGSEGELSRLVSEALSRHPRIDQARARVDQARAEYEERYGFFDPSVYAAAGVSDEVRNLPGLDDLGSVSEEAYEIQAGLELPVRPGFYLGIGAVERSYWNDPEHHSLYETLLGIGVRVPLLRDRGFRVWELDRLRLLAALDGALNDLLFERQSLRHDVEQAYVDVCESVVYHSIARQATERFERLLEETEALVEHKMIAEYQIFAARMESQLSRADELAAKQGVEEAEIRLTELVGEAGLNSVEIDRAAWLEWTESLVFEPVADDAAGCWENRGDVLALIHERVQVTLLMRAEEEQLRGDVSLRAGVTWQDYDSESSFGSGGADDEDRLGGHVMLVYERPLGFRAEKSRVLRYKSRVAEVVAQRRVLELELDRLLRQSETRFEFARVRFEQNRAAVESATRNLAAENERFQLGESRSRDVLDAQKDVTLAERQRTAAAAEVMRAWSDGAFALGYPRSGLAAECEREKIAGRVDP